MMITTLFVVECVNIAFIIIFFVLFVARLVRLRHFSHTEKYANYYPKLRIIFSIIYIVLSIALLSYNISQDIYSDSDWYEYLFQGGGGQCLDSIILILQLVVLRFELNKEKPYTPIHLAFFFYLCFISLVRFSFALVDFINLSNEPVNLILATLLVVDSGTQLAYWLIKRLSLPIFENATPVNIDQFKAASRLLSRRMIDFSERSVFDKDSEETFPFIRPTVKIEKSRFKIILVATITKKILPEEEETDLNAKNRNDFLEVLLRKSEMSKTSKCQEILSEAYYEIDEIKRLYTICGRFPMTKRIKFTDVEIHELASSLQMFLEQLFRQKRAYQDLVLKYLKVPAAKIKEYTQIIEKENDMIARQSQIDNTVGIKLSWDKNSIYLSVQVFRQLWIEDHYEFYMKIIIKSSGRIVYPMKRFSEFQDLHTQLKGIILHSQNMPSDLKLPALPKKHLFYWNEDQINERRTALQVFLKKLANDYTIMEHVQLREAIFQFICLPDIFEISPSFQLEYYEGIQILKGRITKAMVNNELVTFYEFKVYRHGIEKNILSKRFSDFCSLHDDLTRWMNNIQITYKIISLPERHMYGAQTQRHEKLRAYLQNIVEIKEIGKVYSVNVFFNVGGDTSMLDDSDLSAIPVKNTYRQSSSLIKKLSKEDREGESSKVIQMQSPPSYTYSSGQRMSAMIEELGTKDYE